MTTSAQLTDPTRASLGKALDGAIHAALQEWQIAAGRSLRYWLQGYCLSFAETVAKLLQQAALCSVLGSDGTAHHVVVAVGDALVDARGTHSKQSLMDRINQEAAARGCSLRAVDVVPFETKHARLMKECPESERRRLRAYLNTPAMRQICAKFRLAA